MGESVILDSEAMEYACLGGAFLGGGGGGSIEEGRRLGDLAFRAGTPTLARLDQIPDAAVLATVSAVGAPAAPEARLEPEDYTRAVQLLSQQGSPIDGVIASENGGMASINGWYQSAALGIPLVDAPCNGRAHPTGVMGSMGLHTVAHYRSVQAAAGGSRAGGRYVELVFSGRLTDGARLVRQAAVCAGGLVAVARNPVSASYARHHAAPGALTQAIEIGKRIGSAKSGIDAARAVLEYLGGGRVVADGSVAEFTLETRDGFDLGTLRVPAAGGCYELAFCNEFVSLECDGRRIATFPDLIVIMNPANGRPMTTAEVRQGMPVLVAHVPCDLLHLGAGMRYPELFLPLEEMTGKEIIRYLGRSVR